MSKHYLDFIRDNVLFQKKHIQNSYRDISDRQFQGELDAYRKFLLREAENSKKITANKKLGKGLSVFPDYFNKAGIPDEAFLKQSCLYVDEIIIDDPVFKYTPDNSSQSEVFGKYMGLPTRNRRSEKAEIAKAVASILKFKPAIRANFIRLLPVSYLHESPDNTPVTILSNYREVLPPELLEWFKENAKVSSVKEVDGSWIVLDKEPLVPANAINIRFADTDMDFAELYLDIAEVVEDKNKPKSLRFRLEKRTTLPEEEEFRAWVNDVVNKHSTNFAGEVVKEFEMAEELGSFFLTRTTFVDEFIKKAEIRGVSNDAKSFQEEIYPLTLNLDLPVLEHISLEDIVNIREKDGDVFRSFRLELEKQLRDLRAETDPHKLKLNIQKIAHELHEVQINEVNKKIGKVRNDIHIDTGIILAGVGISIFTGGVSIPIIGTAAIAGLGKGYKDVSQQNREIKQNPAFFLWKLKKKVQGD